MSSFHDDCDTKGVNTSNTNTSNTNSVTTTAPRIDEKNQHAINTLATQGEKAFLKEVFTGDNGQPLTYGEMRERYG